MCEIVDVVMGKTELIMNIAVIFAGGVGKRMNSASGLNNIILNY